MDNKYIAQDVLWVLWQWGTIQEYIKKFDNAVVALPDLATDDAIHTFIYGFKPYLKVLVKAKAQVITDVSLNKVMIVMLKLEENI